ncbi:DUF1566 domain-containing protein [Salinispirillum marinum]|uniref:DUF1566 domain-containing protein n=2 Tax=Saccharospirillaceae TaxID=255527 RepID=A0ABV8BDZ0_9GAMM
MLRFASRLRLITIFLFLSLPVLANAQLIEQRFELRGATVVDTSTGLQWMRCSIGQTWSGSSCQGDATQLTWIDAVRAGPLLNQQDIPGFEGFTDWRLPTLEELLSLVYCSSNQPARFKGNNTAGCRGRYTTPTIVASVFPNTTSGWYWTTTSESSTLAWSIAFHYGYADNDQKTLRESVRLVRVAD